MERSGWGTLSGDNIVNRTTAAKFEEANLSVLHDQVAVSLLPTGVRRIATVELLRHAPDFLFASERIVLMRPRAFFRQENTTSAFLATTTSLFCRPVRPTSKSLSVASATTCTTEITWPWSTRAAATSSMAP